MPNVTICIPVAPYHRALLDRAVKSANEQTVPVEVFVYEDTELRGSGYSRNKALAEVTSEYVVFLDADDQLSPNFVQRCLSVIKPNHYIYTDWVLDGNVITAPNHCWQADTKQWHVITTLLPTAAVKAIGGFDETLRAGEDTYMYYALTRSGVCGIPLHEALFTYGRESQRSQILYDKLADGIRASAYYDEVIMPLFERYKNMSCCGGENPIQSFVPDQPGDVQALALWGGNRRELGVISGRLYPRGGNMNPMSVDPRDIDASPEKWVRVRVEQPAPVMPPQTYRAIGQDMPAPDAIKPTYAPPQPLPRVLNGVGELARAVYGKDKEVLTAQELQQILSQKPVTVKPDAAKVRRLAKGKK